MTDPLDSQTAALDQVEAALRDITWSYGHTHPPIRNAVRSALRHRAAFGRWAVIEFRMRQQRRAVEGLRWRDRPAWLSGRLAVLAVYLAFAFAYFDVNICGDLADFGMALAVTGGWLLVHCLLRTTAGNPVALRWARRTGKTWPLAAVLTAVIEARLWPGGFLAVLLGT
ncbi:hypothetical protein [Kitasatospora purpeofusca]|uniref:hypothetical protein n=1 Tax=Kitasatospora purpeofusca TaxID=67352 RepID=UPI0035E3141E